MLVEDLKPEVELDGVARTVEAVLGQMRRAYFVAGCRSRRRSRCRGRCGCRGGGGNNRLRLHLGGIIHSLLHALGGRRNSAKCFAEIVIARPLQLGSRRAGTDLRRRYRRGDRIGRDREIVQHGVLEFEILTASS